MERTSRTNISSSATGHCSFAVPAHELAAGRDEAVLTLHSIDEHGTIARITLKSVQLDGLTSSMHFFTGESAHSRFLPWPQWPLDRLRRWRNARRGGNVASVAAEVDMTRIAYAWPREIHLAVVGAPEQCNIFPTDLHGSDGPDRYLISLRHTGLACAQVMEHRTLALFRRPVDRHREAYALGHRHMKPMEEANAITAIDGEWNGHARPVGSLSARLLRIEAHGDVGIHRVFNCRVEKEEVLDRGEVLAHVHAAPTAWLMRRGHPLPVRMR